MAACHDRQHPIRGKTHCYSRTTNKTLRMDYDIEHSSAHLAFWDFRMWEIDVQNGRSTFSETRQLNQVSTAANCCSICHNCCTVPVATVTGPGKKSLFLPYLGSKTLPGVKNHYRRKCLMCDNDKTSTSLLCLKKLHWPAPRSPDPASQWVERKGTRRQQDT